MSIEYLNISETYIIYYTSFLFCLQKSIYFSWLHSNEFSIKSHNLNLSHTMGQEPVPYDETTGFLRDGGVNRNYVDNLSVKQSTCTARLN